MFGNTSITQAGGGVSNLSGFDAFGRRVMQTTPEMAGFNKADFIQQLQNRYPDMDLQALMQIADTRESALTGGQPQSVHRVGPTPKPFEFKKSPVHTGLKTNQYGTNTIFS